MIVALELHGRAIARITLGRSKWFIRFITIAYFMFFGTLVSYYIVERKIKCNILVVRVTLTLHRQLQ